MIPHMSTREKTKLSPRAVRARLDHILRFEHDLTVEQEARLVNILEFTAPDSAFSPATIKACITDGQKLIEEYDHQKAIAVCNRTKLRIQQEGGRDACDN